MLDEVFFGEREVILGRWMRCFLEREMVWVLDKVFFVLEGEFGGEGRNL